MTTNEEKLCVECEEPCTDDEYCYGCEHHICEKCDKSAGMLPPSHDYFDHLTEPDEDE